MFCFCVFISREKKSRIFMNVGERAGEEVKNSDRFWRKRRGIDFLI